MDQTVMYKLTYGLFVLTAKEGEKDNGCIVNTVSQVTVTPNRIAVAVNKESYTHDMIVRTGVFNVSILSEKSKFDTYKHWGFKSGKDTDKAAGITFSRAENGVIYLAEETNAYLSAKVVTMTDLGCDGRGSAFAGRVSNLRLLSGEYQARTGYEREKERFYLHGVRLYL